MKAIIETDDFEKMLRRIVKKVVQEEFAKLKASIFPLVSREEQEDIENRYGKPSDDVADSHKMEI